MVIYNVTANKKEYSDISCAWSTLEAARDYVKKEINRIDLFLLREIAHEWGIEFFTLDRIDDKVIRITIAEYMLDEN